MCNFYTIVSQTLNFAIKRFLHINVFFHDFFYFTLAIQQNIYFSHFPWQQFNVQLRKYKARGLIASGYTIQTSRWRRATLGNQGLIFLFWQSDREHFTNRVHILVQGCCFVYNNNKKKTGFNKDVGKCMYNLLTGKLLIWWSQ